MNDEDLRKLAHEMVNDASRGDLEAVKKAVEAGVHPDNYGSNSMPAIIASAMSGRDQVVSYLLENGANPNQYTKDRLSALKSAANNNYPKTVKLLLDYNADPNYERNGEVALTLAGDAKAKECVQLLLPVTDPKYYEKAWQYIDDPEIRKIIEEHAGTEFPEPVDGFGGPKTKMDKHYKTPPTDPLLRQLWYLMDEYIDGMDSPNRAFGYILRKCAINDRPQSFYDNGKFVVDEWLATDLKWFMEDRKELIEKYADVYKYIEEYAKDDESDESDNE